MNIHSIGTRVMVLSTVCVLAATGALLGYGIVAGNRSARNVDATVGDLLDRTSRESLAFDDGAGVTPCHGELILAFDPLALGGGDADAQTARAEHLLNAISDQARLPSQRRFTARERSQAEGIAVPAAMYQDIVQLAD